MAERRWLASHLVGNGSKDTDSDSDWYLSPTQALNSRTPLACSSTIPTDLPHEAHVTSGTAPFCVTCHMVVSVCQQ